MMNTNSILKEYRNGDFEMRLSLFLNYRDIRNEFIKIEKSDFDRISADNGYTAATENAIIYGLRKPQAAGN